MQKFKSVIRQVINGDSLEILNRNPLQDDFSLCIHTYQCLSHEKKQKFNTNLMKSFEKQNTEGSRNLNLLILSDFLSAINPYLFNVFPQKLMNSYQQKSKVLARTKEEKLRLAQNTFIYFYFQYLQIKVWGIKNIESLNLNDLPGSLTYCQSALTALKLVIQYDFVLDYVLLHSEWKNQVKIAIQNILRRSQIDLLYLKQFVGKWSFIIVQEQTFSVHVNDIYEQLIYVSRNVKKFERINCKLQSNLVFQKYEMNKELNMTIQQCMLGKQTERRELYSQKKLKTLGDFQNEQSEMTECQIKVKVPF